MDSFLQLAPPDTLCLSSSPIIGTCFGGGEGHFGDKIIDGLVRDMQKSVKHMQKNLGPKWKEYFFRKEILAEYISCLKTRYLEGGLLENIA